MRRMRGHGYWRYERKEKSAAADHLTPFKQFGVLFHKKSIQSELAARCINVQKKFGASRLRLLILNNNCSGFVVFVGLFLLSWKEMQRKMMKILNW